MVHAADPGDRIEQACGDAAAEQGGDDHPGLGHHGMLALDDGEPAHQVSSPKTRSIFSFSAAGANGFTT